MEKYNGWTNYETWVWKLWIDNDQGSQEFWIDRASECLSEASPKYDWETQTDAAIAMLAADLESDADDMQGETVSLTGPLSDLLSSALGRVDWREIACSLIEDAEDIKAA